MVRADVVHPLVADIDDELLGSQLRHITRRLLDAAQDSPVSGFQLHGKVT